MLPLYLTHIVVLLPDEELNPEILELSEREYQTLQGLWKYIEEEQMKLRKKIAFLLDPKDKK